MARLYSRSKGKSGSKKPPSKVNPEWVELKPQEAIQLIISLANSGHTAPEIGTILRDQYGVPSVKLLTKKSITQILEENGLKEEIPIDLLNLIKRSVQQYKHLQTHKKDFTAKRGYQLTVSKIKRLAKYYIRKGKLNENWRYSPETAALLVK
jgi:small subunit ribosomal protein S15